MQCIANILTHERRIYVCHTVSQSQCETYTSSTTVVLPYYSSTTIYEVYFFRYNRYYLYGIYTTNLGDDTFHIDIKVVGQTKPISTREYYTYHIMVRTDNEHLLLSGRLFLQFIVDIFTKIESQRLSYHTGQLASKRMCKYQTLVDQMEADETNASAFGQRIILSASYTGSPLYMFEKQQNALVYVNKYGKPTLFITLTCNPFWKEI